MSLSKISRSIVVALFVVMIIFFSFINIKIMNSSMEVTNVVTSNIAKLLYAIILIVLVLIYMYIKEKLYKLKVKRKISFIYRYIYITLVIITTSILVIYKYIGNFSKISLLIYIITCILTGFIVKRIIFNVSKSDMLSVLGMFSYSMLLNVIEDKSIMFNSIFLEFSVLFTIYIIQKLIDELKQRGLKTKKYIKLAIILGISVAFTSILGVNINVWIIVAVFSLFITSNLDSTHFTFPNRIVGNMDKKKKDGILKIERINISKLIISLIIAILIVLVCYPILKFALYRINNVPILENLKSIHSCINFDKSFENLKNYTGSFVSFSKTYYMILFVYILFMEILALVLRRRYDTKSTLIKLIFMTLYIAMATLHINIYYYQPLFSILLVLIAIVNTTNIYYNREERIKLLVS
ncbi:MAG: hypothetical protein Q4D02_04695 [Clostridia bacterium]|nr:hypothetical protein [Clostridia bacterium]